VSKDLLFDVIHNEIIDIVGYEDVTVREAERIAYGLDAYLVPQIWMDRGLTPPKPDWIVFPESSDEVSRLLRLASRHRVPVIPYGGGTGSQGGIVPLYGGILLDLKKMDRIIKIDEESYTVTAEAGVNGQHLEWTLNKKGLTLAHYPASEYGATLGGYVAARGSGTLSTKYGKAEDMVLSIAVVLPSGERIRTLPVPNHSCGPGLLQLFIGSEGTLGVIAEVTMRVDPMPEERRWRAYLFDDIRKGLEAGRRIMTKRLRPCTIRLYDENSTQRIVKRVLDLEVEGSYMVIGSDGTKEFVDLEMRNINEICSHLDGKDLGPELGEHWWKHRYDFYFPPLTLMLPQMFGTIETTATFDRIYDIYVAKKHVIEKEFKDWNATYIAHFSHWFPWGVMVYDRFIIDKPPQDPHEALQLHTQIWGRAARTSIQHGGVLNDHHGIGFKLGWLMPEQYGTAWPVLQGIKDLLDPLGIMNPGKLGFIRR
jgi:alkyldihydroxyacetonephosphate synthase